MVAEFYINIKQHAKAAHEFVDCGPVMEKINIKGSMYLIATACKICMDGGLYNLAHKYFDNAVAFTEHN